MKEKSPAQIEAARAAVRRHRERRSLETAAIGAYRHNMLKDAVRELRKWVYVAHGPRLCPQRPWGNPAALARHLCDALGKEHARRLADELVTAAELPEKTRPTLEQIEALMPAAQRCEA